MKADTSKKKRITKAEAIPPSTESHAAVIAEVQRLLAPLEIAATSMNGDKEAGAALVALASSLCSTVADFVCCHKNDADEIARGRVSWPILCNVHPTFRARNLRYLDVLPLGESSAWQPIGRKAYSVSNPVSTAVYCAVVSIQTLRALRGKSPTPPTFKEVFSRVEELNGRVEKSPALRPLGLSFADGKRDTCPRGSRSYESNVRAGIRDRLRKAFRGMFTFPEK